MDNEKIIFSDISLHLNIQSIELDGVLVPRGLHIHNEIELVYARQGSLLCQIKDDVVTLEEGSLALINSRVQHRLSDCGAPCKCTYLQLDIAPYARHLFPESKIQLPLLLCCGKVRSAGIYDAQSELFTIFSGIQAELAGQRRHRDAYVKAWVFQLLAFLCRYDFYADGSEIEKKIKGILPAISYIEANYQQKLDLADISSQIHISKFHFCKVFREATGMTVSQYVNALRLYHAQTLLLETKKSVSDIAYECGFGSTQNFNLFFKKELLLTPRAYRKLKGDAQGEV